MVQSEDVGLTKTLAFGPISPGGEGGRGRKHADLYGKPGRDIPEIRP